MKKLYFILVVTIPSWAFVALAQVGSPSPSAGASPIGDIPVDNPIVKAVVNFILGVADKYPKVATVIFIIGGLRLLLKPIFSLAHNVFQYFNLVAYDQKETAIEQSKPVQFFFYLLDLFGSVKVPVKIAPDVVEEKK